MEWQTILSLSEDELNLAIEKYCTTHEWRWDATEPGGGKWMLHHVDIPGTLWSTVAHLHYTASWERTMDLCRRYHINQEYGYIDDSTRGWHYSHAATGPEVDVLDPAEDQEHRIALCRLAVWQSCHGQASQG